MITLHTPTPLVFSHSLEKILGRPVYLKMEALQPTGSFKLRGTGLACARAVENGARHLVASSGGNAGYAVAYAARKLGVAATVFVPATTTREMCERIMSEGADVRVAGSCWAEAHAVALEFAFKSDASVIHPYDDPVLWEGHAGMIDEIALDIADPACVVLAVGGGGLLCGAALGMQRNGWDHAPILAIETSGSAKYLRSLAIGQQVILEKPATLATSLATDRVCKQALDWANIRPIVPFTVTDEQAISACLRFADDHRILVEPSCGATLAAAYTHAPFFDTLPPAKPVIIIVCGGIGVSRAKLMEWQKWLNSQTNNFTQEFDVRR